MKFSTVEDRELEKIQKKINTMYRTLLTGMESSDVDMLSKCETIESEVDNMVREFRTNHLLRLRNGKCMPTSGVVFADIILHIERISDLLYRVSRNLIDIIR